MTGAINDGEPSYQSLNLHGFLNTPNLFG